MGSIAVHVAEIQLLNAKRENLMAQIEAVYRQVVPQGKAPNPERQLENKIAEFKGGGSGGSVIGLYAKVAPLIANNDTITLRTMRYSDQTGDMQLTIEAKTYGDVVSLSESINQTGLDARLQNTSQQGDMQQARMVISRAGS